MVGSQKHAAEHSNCNWLAWHRWRYCVGLHVTCGGVWVRCKLERLNLRTGVRSVMRALTASRAYHPQYDFLVIISHAIGWDMMSDFKSVNAVRGEIECVWR